MVVLLSGTPLIYPMVARKFWVGVDPVTMVIIRSLIPAPTNFLLFGLTKSFLGKLGLINTEKSKVQ